MDIVSYPILTFKVNLLKKMDGNGTESFQAEKETAKYKLGRFVSNKIPAAAVVALK